MDFATAKELNRHYNSRYQFTEQCLDVIDDMIRRMTALRAGKALAVQDGDYVICTQLDGTVVSENGHISLNDNRTICQFPNEPFVNKDTLLCTTSGGPWVKLSDEDIKRFRYIDKAVKSFWTWGPGGPKRNGGLSFPVEVNVWKLTHKAF